MTDREVLVGFEEFVREHVLRILLALDNRSVLRGKLSASLIERLNGIRTHLDGNGGGVHTAPGSTSDTGKLAALRIERPRRRARGIGHGRAHSAFGRACRSIVCATCGAGPGAGCVSTFGGQIPNYHSPRKDFAERAVAGRAPT